MLTAVAAGNVTITATSDYQRHKHGHGDRRPATPVGVATVAPTTGTSTEGEPGVRRDAAGRSGSPDGRSIGLNTPSATAASVSTTGSPPQSLPRLPPSRQRAEGRSGTAAATVTNVPVSTVTVTPAAGVWRWAAPRSSRRLHAMQWPADQTHGHVEHVDGSVATVVRLDSSRRWASRLPRSRPRIRGRRQRRGPPSARLGASTARILGARVTFRNMKTGAPPSEPRFNRANGRLPPVRLSAGS